MTVTATVVPTAGAAAGTGASVATSSGNDKESSVTLTIGTTPGTGVLLTVSFFGWSGFKAVVPKIVQWGASVVVKGSGSTTPLGTPVNVYQSATGQTANSSCPPAAIQLSVANTAFTAGDQIQFSFSIGDY